jgi:hypothetical protein
VSPWPSLRYLAYHEHHRERAEARRLYAALPESARDWNDTDLDAAQEAGPSHLDFNDLVPRAERYLA